MLRTPPPPIFFLGSQGPVQTKVLVVEERKKKRRKVRNEGKGIRAIESIQRGGGGGGGGSELKTKIEKAIQVAIADYKSGDGDSEN